MQTKIFTALSLITCLAACDVPLEPPTEPPAEAAAEVTQAALDVERATRMIDRGQDLDEAVKLIDAALEASELTPDERGLAVVALSRAAEAKGDRERAITLVEDELARPNEQTNRAARRQALRDRLRELLNGTADRPASLVPNVDASPFSEVLSRYFPETPSGEVFVNILLFGGSREVSEKVGAFDVAAGYRAARNEACPLCEPNIDMHSSTSRSGDWTAIPESEEQMDDRLVVFYFDLERHRIPARYDALLPMPVAEIEAKVKGGEGFALAKEREGAPPVILIAAPRTVMLEEVETALAASKVLPTEPLAVPLQRKLYPREIQTVIRTGYFSHARSCYEALLETDPKAEGRVMLTLEVDGEGRVSSHEMRPEGLEGEAFLACMGRKVPELTFPASGDTVKINYPVIFTPN